MPGSCHNKAMSLEEKTDLFDRNMEVRKFPFCIFALIVRIKLTIGSNITRYSIKSQERNDSLAVWEEPSVMGGGYRGMTLVSLAALNKYSDSARGL